MNSKKAFEKFYNANIDKIYRFVFFRVGQNKELAEDLVSEIFIKALKNFDSYDEKISRSAWIFTIAKNHLANYWRDQKNTDSLPEEDILLDKDWLELAKSKERGAKEKIEIYNMLAKLSPEDYDLVTLHYLFGYSYSEIVTLKGKSETAVKVAVHRAIKSMRKNI